MRSLRSPRANAGGEGTLMVCLCGYRTKLPWKFKAHLEKPPRIEAQPPFPEFRMARSGWPHNNIHHVRSAWKWYRSTETPWPRPTPPQMKEWLVSAKLSIVGQVRSMVSKRRERRRSG